MLASTYDIDKYVSMDGSTFVLYAYNIRLKPKTRQMRLDNTTQFADLDRPLMNFGQSS